MTSHTDDAATQLWRIAQSHRPTSRLLEEVLIDRTLGRILLLHRDELFPRLNAQLDRNLSFLFGTSALLLLSHPLKVILSSMKRLDQKRRAHWFHGPRQSRASEVVREFDDTTRQTLIDNLAVETLKLVQSSPALRALVTQNDPITRDTLKRNLGDYSTLNWAPLRNAGFQFMQRALAGKRSKKALHQIAIEVDALKDFIDIEQFQLLLLGTTLAHYRKLIRGLRIPERLWRETILTLHSEGFLEHVGPLYLWCIRCPESGVLASVRTTQLLRPLRCPRCARASFSATTLFPADTLDLALGLRDGMLGAAIGWEFTKRRIPFRHCLNVGGTEVDFLVPQGLGHHLIECKMNHRIKGRPRLLAALTDNMKQLAAHAHAAQSTGIALHSAVCVVNQPQAQLTALLHLVPPPRQSPVPLGLLSYEEFVPWIRKHQVSLQPEA